ncbi:MAG: T9SS type A sorting domain-containing protein [Chitinophagales bacterium]
MRIFTLLFVALSAFSASAQLTTIYSENVGSPTGTPLITAYTGWQNGAPIVYGGTGDVRSTSGSSGYSGASGNGNVFLNSSGGPKTLTISGINTIGYTQLRLRMGLFKSTLASNGSELLAEVSTDGTNYTTVRLDSLPTGSGTAIWRLVSSKDTLPATANLRLRFTNTASNTMNFRLDDIRVTSGIQLDSVITAPSTFGSPLCAGAPVSIAYSLRGSFNSTNYFVAQLSDASGSFANAVTLDSLNGFTAGTINTKIPLNTPSGSGYRIRISSTDPQLNGIDNGSPITIKAASFLVRNDTICQGSGVLFNGVLRTASGVYLDTLAAANGCDSFVTLNLTVKSRSQSAVSDSFCPGSIYVFHGRNISTAGTYRDTTVAANGCDSIIVLTLTLKHISRINVSASICTGTNYAFHGQQLAAAGTYRDTVAGMNGCDSITTLTLTLKPTASLSFTDSICPGRSYNFHGNLLTQAGTYRDTLPAANGCDSVITLTLKWRNQPQTNLLDSICPGQPYFFGGQQLQNIGVYYDTLSAVNTCDSIVMLTLIFKQPTFQLQSDTICSGESYSFNGKTLTQQGVYDDTLASSSGCQIIMRLYLTVIQLTKPVITKTGNTLGTGAYTTYQWLRDGVAITNAKAQQYVTSQFGAYTVAVTGAHGCKDTSAVFVISGIADNTGSLAFGLYPNPASGNCYLELPELAESAEVLITSPMGTLMKRFTVHSAVSVIDLEELSEGVYIVEVRSGSQRGFTKMVVR